MSSRLGLVAEVIATESPSQLKPGGHPQDMRGDRLGLLLLRVRIRQRRHPVSSRSAQQIRGSGSPTSWSITRLPPKLVSTSTIPGGSVRTSPISAAASHPGTRAQRRQRPVGGLRGHERDQLALVGDVHRVDPEDLGRAGDLRHAPGPALSRTIIATDDARASSFSTEATPPRVASRKHRSSGPTASSSASTTGHSERCPTRSPRRARTRRGRA